MLKSSFGFFGLSQVSCSCQRPKLRCWMHFYNSRIFHWSFDETKTKPVTLGTWAFENALHSTLITLFTISGVKRFQCKNHFWKFVVNWFFENQKELCWCAARRNQAEWNLSLTINRKWKLREHFRTFYPLKNLKLRTLSKFQLLKTLKKWRLWYWDFERRNRTGGFAGKLFPSKRKINTSFPAFSD